MANYVIKIVDDVKKLSERLDETVLNTVTFIAVKNCAKELKQTLLAHKDVVALTASQIGRTERMLSLKFKDGVVETFINPMIFSSKGLHMSEETCASLPGKTYIIPRSDEIDVAYTNIEGRAETNRFTGFAAEVFQQAYQLLDGVLISDFGLEIDDDFKQASEEERHEVVKMYLDSLKKRQTDLKEQIENNPHMKQLNDAIDFMISTTIGKTKLIKGEEKRQEEIEELKKSIELKKEIKRLNDEVTVKTEDVKEEK